MRCRTLEQLGKLFGDGAKQASPHRPRNLGRIGHPHTRVFGSSSRIPDRLRGIGVQVVSLEALAAGLRPEDVDMEPEPSLPKHGWQKFASVTM